MYQWSDIRLFLAVAEAGSTLAASRTLGINQTTVSRRMQVLEHGLGLTLFHRRNRGYTLTEDGAALLASAKSVALATAALGAKAEQLRRALAGVIRVTAPEAVFQSVLAEIIVDFSQQYREVQIEHVSAEAALDIKGGEVDVAFRASQGDPDPDLVGRKLPGLGWTAYCSRTYADRRGLPDGLDDLAGHAIVAYEKALGMGQRSLAFATHFGAAQIVARSNSVPNMRGLLRAGMGVGLLPCMHGDSDPDLMRCAAPEAAFNSEWWLLTTEENRKNPSIRRFIDHAAASLRKKRKFLSG